MSIPNNYQQGNDPELRTFLGLAAPIRVGTITALEANGQVRVLTDAADGEDVLAWPLNGWQYAVGDIVFIASPQGTPDSAIVLGARSPIPELDPLTYPHDHTDKVARDGSTPLTADWDIGDARKLLADILRARDAAGLSVTDDAGNGLHVADGGNVGIGTITPTALLHLLRTNAFALMYIQQTGAGNYGAQFQAQTDDCTLLFAAYDDGYTGVAAYAGNTVVQATGGKLILSAFEPGNDIEIYVGQRTTPDVYIKSGGNVGLGITPQGRLHAHDGTGGLLFVTKTGINATAQTIIPNGTGDVTKGISFLAIVVDSSNNIAFDTYAITPAVSRQIITTAGNSIRLYCNADGSLTTARDAGTRTFTLILLAIWL